MFARCLLLTTLTLAMAGCDSSKDSEVSDAHVESLGATSYCETIAPSFCGFYLRCGRMDVETQEDCESNFLESCNSKYEGAYVELEAQGFMGLSREGIAACEEHLQTVECAQQVFELTGPCADIWEGTQSIGQSCGLDSEFFVCDSNSECVLSLYFCGTCLELVPLGETCEPGEQTCGSEAFCSNGLCKARKRNGENCGDEDRCSAGSSCVDGSCLGPTFVGRNDACDRANRCPYLTECIGGRCEVAVLQGQSCDATTTCATGYCDQGVCVAPQDNGSSCSSASQCRSLLCTDGQCQPRPSACMQ